MYSYIMANIFDVMVTMMLIAGIIFPKRRPDNIMRKQLKFGDESLSRVEHTILNHHLKYILTKWYEEMQPKAVALSSLARDCIVKTYSDKDNIKFSMPVGDVVKNGVLISKEITVVPYQFSIRIKLEDLVNVDVVNLLSEKITEKLAIAYDTIIYWGDGQNRPCGLINNNKIRDTGVVICSEKCLDDPYSLNLTLLKIINHMPLRYYKSVKWYANKSAIEELASSHVFEYIKDSSEVSIHGQPLEMVDIMPDTLHKPYPIFLANMAETYCIVDKIDEFKIFRTLDDDGVEFIITCEIGGAVLKPEAITLMGISEYSIRQ